MIFYVTYEQKRYIMNIMYANKKKISIKKIISKQEMCLLMFAFVQSIVRTKFISQKNYVNDVRRKKKNLNKKFISRPKNVFIDIRIFSKHRTNKTYITKNHVSDVRKKKKISIKSSLADKKCVC